jgi:hypothetical protein
VSRRAASKELKVRLPLDQHVQLHTLKVLHGQPIHVTVQQALAAYFRDFEAAQGQAPAPPAQGQEPPAGR